MTKSDTVDLLISATLLAGIAIWSDLLLTASLRNTLPMYPWDMIVNIFSVIAAYMLISLSIQRWRPSRITKIIISTLLIAAYATYYTISLMPILQ